jgi:16S rRNA (guanine(966)-N(2))-methyltransferase RsmD
MRVTGGKAKGTQLKTLSGRSIRPTTDIVREAIFSLLDNTATGWCQALDLYAGSGALGIEALSRKAEWVDFVDHRKKCCDIIKYNLEKTGVLHKAHIYCCSVTKAVSFLSNNYDIVFIDPPYSDPCNDDLLINLANSKLVGQNSTIVVCHANRFPLNPNYDGLHLVKQRRYGDTFISIYQGGGL